MSFPDFLALARQHLSAKKFDRWPERWASEATWKMESEKKKIERRSRKIEVTAKMSDVQTLLIIRFISSIIYTYKSLVAESLINWHLMFYGFTCNSTVRLFFLLGHSQFQEQQALDHLTFTRAQVKGFRELFVENVPLACLIQWFIGIQCLIQRLPFIVMISNCGWCDQDTDSKDMITFPAVASLLNGLVPLGDRRASRHNWEDIWIWRLTISWFKWCKQFSSHEFYDFFPTDDKQCPFFAESLELQVQQLAELFQKNGQNFATTPDMEAAKPCELKATPDADHVTCCLRSGRWTFRTFWG